MIYLQDIVTLDQDYNRFNVVHFLSTCIKYMNFKHQPVAQRSCGLYLLAEEEK
jgi:hypothetical protein